MFADDRSLKPDPKKRPAQPSEKPPEHVLKQAKLDAASSSSDTSHQEGDKWVQAKIAEAAAADAGEKPKADAPGNVFEFEPSWLVALDKYQVDGEARLQLALLRDSNWHAASEVVWKLTKKGAYDADLKNPSGFVNRCCTTAMKSHHEQW
jgi:hypothetical protein